MAGVDGLGPVGAIDIHYAIAKAFEDVGDIDAAFQHFIRAGTLQAARTRWSPSQDRRLLAALRDRVTAEHYAVLRREATASSKPVFIVGMPRSGTTLIEQIIASHPDAAGCGEPDAAPGVLDGLCLGPLTIDTTTGTTGAHLVHGRGLSIAERGAHYLQALEQRADPGGLRLVDKLTTNHRWVGVLDCILPGSHFIHAQRHPAETCLSLFRLWFGDQIPYSYTLADLAAAYRLCHDFMQHWRALLPPGRILDIRHEDLVADPEFQARRIIAFIGLPWDERCLRFYQSERRIATASAIQVRRPIYAAPPKWRRYATHLAPLLEALSDLIRDYEASGSNEYRR